MLLLLAATSAPSFARGGKWHSGGRHFSGAHVGAHRFGRAHPGFGVVVAAPVFWNFPPLPYYPPTVIAPSAPPVYIEQGGADRPAGYWYYCADSGAYYPYVKECAGAWQPVAPQAPQSE